jgi:hypothetical protein
VRNKKKRSSDNSGENRASNVGLTSNASTGKKKSKNRDRETQENINNSDGA